MGLLVLTIFAQTGEGELTVGNRAAGAGGCRLIQFLRNPELAQIHHFTAAGADVVDMGDGVGVKPLYAGNSANADHQAQFFEKGQVPVDRADGQIRDLRRELGEDPLGSV